MFKRQIQIHVNACTYTSLLEIHKGNHYMTTSTQSFSRCRTRMIRILLSEKASQTLNSIMLKCVVCMDKTEAAYFIAC